jgi:hypothetical protein
MLEDAHRRSVETLLREFWKGFCELCSNARGARKSEANPDTSDTRTDRDNATDRHSIRAFGEHGKETFEEAGAHGRRSLSTRMASQTFVFATITHAGPSTFR